MKTTVLLLILFLTGLDLWAQTPPPPTNVPAALRRLPIRRNAATNNPALMPQTAPGIPAASGSPASSAFMPTPTTPLAATPVSPTTGLPASSPAAPAASSSAPAGSTAAEVAGYTYDFPGVDVNQVLDIYADLIGRTLLRAGLPNAQIVLHTQTPLTKSEAIQALQAVLALNGIAVVNIGDKFCKVGPVDQANTYGAKLDSTDATNLPELGSYITHITQLKNVLPSKMVPIIQPLAKLNSIIPIDDNYILVIRDYAENVKRMLEMIDKIDISVPAVYISEVIPIRYAQADDIASALNSLGGSGSATVSFGGSAASPGINGVRSGGAGSTPFGSSGTGMSGQLGNYGNNPNQPRTLGGSTSPNGQASTINTPGGANTTPFQQRLMNIINRANQGTGGGGGGGGQEQIQVFGQAKIIADERSNSLLVFATRQDMDQIKNVIKQLDVLLAQVLIEAAIIDYSLGPDTLDFGVSAAQRQKTWTSEPIQTAGLINNNQPFYNFVQSVVTNGGILPGIAGNPPNNFNYWGNIGQTWAVALQAAAADSHASIVQRPRIQTSQAKPAQFFVGQTVPYVTSTYNYGGINGNQSSYSQLSVGVELDVTPFINPDGLVVMDINQEIDNINGSTQIAGVGAVPNTDKRTFSSEIAVRDKDTVMLGGFINSQKNTSRTGVPLLMDIPLLGNLFTSRHDSKQRQELIVMMHPTVLKTPAIAAAQTVAEQQRLPGVQRAQAEDALQERKTVNDERQWEIKNHIQGLMPEASSGALMSPAPMDTPTPSPQEYPFTPVRTQTTTTPAPSADETPAPPAPRTDATQAPTPAPKQPQP
jgi:general secretion pathway protein D